MSNALESELVNVVENSLHKSWWVRMRTNLKLWIPASSCERTSWEVEMRSRAPTNSDVDNSSWMVGWVWCTVAISFNWRGNYTGAIDEINIMEQTYSPPSPSHYKHQLMTLTPVQCSEDLCRNNSPEENDFMNTLSYSTVSSCCVF